jgi:hypothetical protein
MNQSLTFVLLFIVGQVSSRILFNKLQNVIKTVNTAKIAQLQVHYENAWPKWLRL